MATYTEETDAAASRSTAYKIAAGDTFTGALATGDADWIKVSLTAGKAYQFDMSGTVGWAGLQVMDADGIAIATMRVADEFSLRRLAARLGGDVEILEPPAARRAVVEWAEAGLAQYP